MNTLLNHMSSLPILPGLTRTFYAAIPAADAALEADGNPLPDVGEVLLRQNPTASERITRLPSEGEPLYLVELWQGE